MLTRGCPSTALLEKLCLAHCMLLLVAVSLLALIEMHQRILGLDSLDFALALVSALLLDPAVDLVRLRDGPTHHSLLLLRRVERHLVLGGPLPAVGQVV